MTFKEFVGKIQLKNPDLPKYRVRKIVKDVFETIAEEVLKNDQEIKIANFGKFQKKETKEKKVKFKDKVYNVPKMTTIKFKSSSNLS